MGPTWALESHRLGFESFPNSFACFQLVWANNLNSVSSSTKRGRKTPHRAVVRVKPLGTRAAPGATSGPQWKSGHGGSLLPPLSDQAAPTQSPQHRPPHSLGATYSHLTQSVTTYSAGLSLPTPPPTVPLYRLPTPTQTSAPSRYAFSTIRPSNSCLLPALLFTPQYPGKDLPPLRAEFRGANAEHQGHSRVQHPEQVADGAERGGQRKREDGVGGGMWLHTSCGGGWRSGKRPTETASSSAGCPGPGLTMLGGAGGREQGKRRHLFVLERNTL